MRKYSMKVCLALLFLLLGLTGCSVDNSVLETCNPGIQISCPCPSQELGTQVCMRDGKRFGVCSCPLGKDFETVAFDDGLIWQKEALQKEMSFVEAYRYCKSLSSSNHQDWRMPNIDELRTISIGCPYRNRQVCDVHESCLDPLFCGRSGCEGCSHKQGPANGCYWRGKLHGPCTWYWSSSPTLGPVLGLHSRHKLEKVWCIDFATAKVSTKQADYIAAVRCVRGGI
jgi:hypothetical protein